MNRGLKPYNVCSLLEIPKETLRYWKINLDPVPQRTEFDSSTILTYRVIATCINKQGLTVQKLKESGIEKVFHECKKSINELKRKLFVFNEDNQQISFEDYEKNELNVFSPSLRVFSLKKIIDDHIDSMLSIGSPDIHSIKSG